MIESDLTEFPVNCKPVRICASLIVTSELMPPEDVTKTLGIIPTSTFRQGTAKHSGEPNRIGYWELNSHHMVADDINEHLYWLLRQLRDKADHLHQLQEKNYSVNFICRFGIAHWSTRCTLNHDVVALLEALKLPISLQIFDEQD